MLAKLMRVFFIVVMLGLLAVPATLLMAAEGSGDMTELEPGGQHWYTLSYRGSGTVEVRMNVEPNGSAYFVIATPDGARSWAAGGELESIGRGTENEFESADLFWTGSFGSAGDYYLIVEYSGNGRDPAYYSLDVSGADLSGGPEADEAEHEEGEEAAVHEDEDKDEAAKTEESQPAAAPLAKAAAVARLSNQAGRAIVSARGNHFVVDSIPPVDGPNEEINPMDLLLGAQATCAAFVYETASQEMGQPLSDITATVEADLNGAGIKDGSVNPRLQAMRVHMDIPGASDEQAAKLAEEFKARCPMYTTMIRAVPIEVTHGEKPEASVAEGLATASAVARVSNQPGRAIVSARGNHFVVDSVPPLGGPNEERNPLDLALGALATCGTFLYEAAANEMDIPLSDISTTVEAEFDARGVKDGSVNPRIQVFRMKIELAGATPEQAAALTEEYKARCPVYTTLSRSAPIEIETVTK